MNRRNGIACGKHRVRRLRKEQGLQARRMRRFHVIADSRLHSTSSPHLLQRNFTVAEPDRVWTGDVTFIASAEGWVYLAVLLDLYSRAVIGWAMSSRLDQALLGDALRMAIAHRRPKPGLLHHSD